MQQILIPTADFDVLGTAKDNILDRSLLYDATNNNLYIKFNDELKLLSLGISNLKDILNSSPDFASFKAKILELP